MGFVIDVVWGVGGGGGDDGVVGGGIFFVGFDVVCLFYDFEYFGCCLMDGDEVGVGVVEFVDVG